MDLRIVVRVTREHWLLIVAAVTVTALLGIGVTLRQTPTYAARTTLFVSSWGGNSDALAAYQGSLLSQQRVKSYAQLLRGDRVMGAAVAQLKLNMSASQLSSKITAEVIPDTVMLAVTATDTSPSRARDIANAVGDQFTALVVDFESTTEGKTYPVRVSIVDRARTPGSPISPKPTQNLILSVLFGLLLGAALAGARYTLDTSVKNVDQLTELTGAPSLGAVPTDPNASHTPLAINDSPYAPRAEAFRKIRTSMQFVDLDRSNKVILVTSAIAGEGKSTTACNIAITAAEAGNRVLLIEGDLRRPLAARYLGLPGGVGLTSVLVGNLNIAVAVQSWGELLSVLASGPLPPNPSELLGSQHMRQLLAQMRRQYDLVVIDGPPVLPVADASALANACDGTILVVRHGKTKRDQIQDVVTALRTVDAHILGTVLNVVPANKGSKYHYDTYRPALADPDRSSGEQLAEALQQTRAVGAARTPEGAR